MEIITTDISVGAVIERVSEAMAAGHALPVAIGMPECLVLQDSPMSHSPARCVGTAMLMAAASGWAADCGAAAGASLRVKRLLLAASLLLAPSLALAQGGPVQQSGQITPGHPPSWITNGVIGDGGSALNGRLRELGVTNTGTPVCISDAPTTGPYHQLCFGANSLGGGLISYNAYGGAPNWPLKCNVNGKISDCVGAAPSGGSVFVSPFDYGCKGDATADDTQCMQAAINASPGTAGVWVGGHLFRIGPITMPPFASIVGSNMGFYPAGQMAYGAPNCNSGLVANAPNLPHLISMSRNNRLQELCILDGGAGRNTSGIAVTMEAVCGPSGACPESLDNVVNRVLIDQPCIGLAMSGQFNNMLNSWVGRVLPGGSTPTTYCGGIRLGAMTNSNRTIQPNLYNNNVYTDYTTPAQYALLILDAGGPYLTNNELNVAKYNQWWYPGFDISGANGSQNVQAVTATGNLNDWSTDANLYIGCQAGSFGAENGGSVINSDWFGSAGRASGNSNATAIIIKSSGGGCKVVSLQLNNIRIINVFGNGIDVETVGDGTLDGGVWNLSITNSHICGNTGIGINIGANIGSAPNTGTNIHNNVVGGHCDTQDDALAVALNLGGNNFDLNISGNDFSDATVPAQISGPNTPGDNSYVANNRGIDDRAAQISSLTSWPLNPTVLYTGTGTLSLPSPTYCCPTKTLIPTAGNVTLAGQVSVASFVAQQNLSTFLTFVGGDWFPK